VQGDALLLEEAGEQRPRVGMVAGQQPLGHVDDRHVRAHPAEGLRELAAHRPGPDDDQPLRHLVRGGGLAVRPGLGIGQPRDGRNRGHRPGGDEQPPKLDDAAVRLDGAPAGDARRAAHELDVESGQPLLLARVVQIPGHLVTVPERPLDIDRAGHRLGRAGHEPGGGDRLGRPQERLGRHAGEVRALAPDQAVLDERDRCVGLEAAQGCGGGLARRAAAQDHQPLGSHGCHPRCPVPSPPVRQAATRGVTC
jgi:hypothetical protein